MKSNYIVIPLFAIIIALIGRLLSQSCDAMTWYKSLTLPALTPPNWVFPVAWNIIFASTTVAAIIVWNSFTRNVQFWAIIALFSANSLLNVFWTYLFFNQNLIGASLIDAIALEFTTLALMFLISSRAILVGLLILPYSLWGAFAIYLNYLIWYTN